MVYVEIKKIAKNNKQKSKRIGMKGKKKHKMIIKRNSRMEGKLKEKPGANMYGFGETVKENGEKRSREVN